MSVDIPSPAAGHLEELRRMSQADLRDALPLVDKIESKHSDNIRLCAVLNAYRAVIEYDGTGEVTPRSQGAAAATLELHELIGPLGRFDVAKKLLYEYVAAWPGAQALVRTFDMVPDNVQPVDGFRDDPEADLQVVPKNNADTTLLVFTGRRHKFGISLNILHHCWLAPLSCNVIYLRDFAELIYLRGIQSIGGGEDETLCKLQEIIASMASRRLVCLGNSGGVFGAWYYGIRLGAQYVLNFSGPSSLDIGLRFKAKYYGQLRELHKQGVIPWPDVRALYERDPKAAGRVFYACGNEFDRVQAEHLAGLKNVSLSPLEGTSAHFVIDQLVRAGEFQSALAAATGREEGSIVWGAKN
jgi:hypothetical protein